MLWQKNNGVTREEVLQNQFTAYVKKAIRNRKTQYIFEKNRKLSFETDCCTLLETAEDPDQLIQDFVELDALRVALKKVNGKERFIVLAHAVEGKPLTEIARELNMKYATVACQYYRTMKKLRQCLEEGDTECVL